MHRLDLICEVKKIINKKVLLRSQFNFGKKNDIVCFLNGTVDESSFFDRRCVLVCYVKGLSNEILYIIGEIL